MGATKENIIIEKEQQETSEYYELIGRLQQKKESLSYSSLKAFAKSPRNFIKYKLKERTPQTESQIFGSLCDCLLTTPDKFEDMFKVVDNLPTTDNQKSFCDCIIKGMSLEDAFKANYKRGNKDDIYESLKDYCDAVIQKKLVCTSVMLEQSKEIVENLKKSELVMQYIDSCDSFQNHLKWEYKGWKFNGFTDAQGEGLIIDFKYSKDADPDKFERDIINYDYFMQMGMYHDAEGGVPECYFIVYDKSLNFSVIKVDYSFISYGVRKYKYLVTKLNQCVKENRFNESYNFFDVEQRTVFKPKWIKGFETDDSDVE